jgi:hypothetical protein
MATMNDYYKLCPQMRVYAELPNVIAPYMIFTAKPDFRSDVVNTDRYGFRWSAGTEGITDADEWRKRCKRGIVMGGSFVFGLGATQDRYTVTSHLGSLTNCSFLNLGIISANSTQELISSIPFLPETDYVVICSGVNNLVTNHQSIGRNEMYGPFYYEHIYETLSSYNLRDLAGLVESSTSKISSVSRLLWEIAMRAIRTAGKQAPTSLEVVVEDSNTETFSTSFKHALDLQMRDLRLISKLINTRTKLIFALQPFSFAIKRSTSTEEKALFAMWDERDGTQEREWKILRTKMIEWWDDYVIGLCNACKEHNIQFVDLNTLKFDGWCFIDRIHTTDNGNEQVARRIAEEII